MFVVILSIFFCGGDVGDDTRSNLFLLLRLEWFFLMVKKVHLNKNLIKFSLSQNIDFFRSKVTHLTLMNLNKLFKAINLHFFRSYIFSVNSSSFFVCTVYALRSRTRLKFARNHTKITSFHVSFSRVRI